MWSPEQVDVSPTPAAAGPEPDDLIKATDREIHDQTEYRDTVKF